MLLPAHMKTFSNHMRRCLQYLANIPQFESIFRHHIFGAHSQRIFNCDRWRLCLYLDLGKPRRPARNVTCLGDHRKNHLSVKFDCTIRKNGVITQRRATIINTRNIVNRKHSNNAPKCPNCIQIKFRDFPARFFQGIAGFHMQCVLRLSYIVNISCSSTRMKFSTVMG